ncbi:aminotransferase class I/II-fold pyridoxal phosphate-dependent enzyme [Salmonella enterica subsp. enterica serovar Cerro]|nr:aminotransferase class I/II-fold pyridoxal phosphate-dependent enzyme [Salmonella enterica subsp. enterica serovar Cerro]
MSFTFISDFFRFSSSKEFIGFRNVVMNTLQEKGANRDFSFIIKQNGMFSFSGLTKDQVLRLREEFGVYAVASGRVNVAGMTPDNMAPLCEAIVAVL